MNSKVKITAALATLALASATVGCGAFGTKNKGQKGRENDNALAGKWQNSCSKMDWLGFSYNQVTFNFSGLGDFDKTTTLFSDANCATAIGSLTENGTYAALGDSPALTGAQNINFTISEAKVSADTDTAVNLFNGVSYCGISSWQKGQATDVLDKPCVGFQHPKGAVIFDVYKVDQDGKRLQTGKGSLFLDKSEASARPSKLDETNVFTKK